MRDFRMLFTALIAMLLIAACTTVDPQVSSQLDEQADRLDELSEQLDELFASLEKMDSSEMEEVHDAAQASTFEVAVAQYVMDTAGFHAIDDALSETGEIDPATVSAIARVARMVASTQWPDELSEDAGHFREVLMDFEAALSEDDAEAATPLAGMAHDHQHDLSAAITTWLSGEMPMEHEHAEEEEHMEDMEEDEHQHDSDEDMAAAHGVPEEAAAMVNPFAGDEESTTAGGDLYLANCSTCHGETGEGDGPTSSSLEKPPADLHASHVQGLTDGGLFHIITHGVTDTPMPAWEDILTEEQRWHVVNFLRTFQ